MVLVALQAEVGGTAWSFDEGIGLTVRILV